MGRAHGLAWPHAEAYAKGGCGSYLVSLEAPRGYRQCSTPALRMAQVLAFWIPTGPVGHCVAVWGWVDAEIRRLKLPARTDLFNAMESGWHPNVFTR